MEKNLSWDKKPYFYKDGEKVWGSPESVTGSHYGIYGDLTNIRGDISGIQGDMTGIYGDCTGIKGFADHCKITKEERANGVDIKELIREE